MVFWRSGLLWMQRRIDTLDIRFETVGLFGGYGTTAIGGVAAVRRRRPCSYCRLDHASRLDGGKRSIVWLISCTSELGELVS